MAHKSFIIWGIICVLSISLSLLPGNIVIAQSDIPAPPDRIVKLIFIHHSTGENWLRDDYGGLGSALANNNYFVSDTNYGWGPDSIGDRTDILNWTEWFRGSSSATYLDALYRESEQHSDYSRLSHDPGGENEIILFKSCFPNSALEGNPDDPPSPGDALTVSNAKYIYNDLLNYFVTRPDKLFIVITAPPLIDSTYANNARAFNTWLVRDWLSENNYSLNNVAVFDFYNVLTDPNNHHRYNNGQIEYINDKGENTSYYHSDGDDHPNPAGSQKANTEFVPVLNIYYHRWKSSQFEQPQPLTVLTATISPTEPELTPENTPQTPISTSSIHPSNETDAQTTGEPSPTLQTNPTEKSKLCSGAFILPLLAMSVFICSKRQKRVKP